MAEEQGTGVPSLCLKPVYGVFLQGGWDIDASHFVPLGINILVSLVYIPDLKHHQFTDPDTCGRDESYDEVKGVLSVFPKPAFQVFIISLADDAVQIAFLLDADCPYLVIPDSKEFQETVQGPDPYIDGLGLVMIH